MKAIALILATTVLIGPAEAQAQHAPDFPQQQMQRLLTGMQQAVGGAFNQIDANKDNQITREEVSAFTKKHGINQAGTIDEKTWAKSDHNKDGVVSRSEFTRTVMSEYNSVAGRR